MKHLQSLSKKLLPVMALFFISLPFGKNAFAFPTFTGGNYTVQSDKLAIKIELPETWKNHIVSEETNSSIVFKYSNPGGEPVFLFAINKITDADWMKIKDQISNCQVLMHNGSTIYYCEKTAATRLKGTNNDEYKTIIANLDEVIHSVKSL